MKTNDEVNKLEGLTLCWDKATACMNHLEPFFANWWIMLRAMLIKDLEIQAFPQRSCTGANKTAEQNQELVGAVGSARQMAPGVM